MPSALIELKDVSVTSDDLIKHLHLTGAYGPALASLIRREVVHKLAGEKSISVSDEELQRAVDAWRKATGLHLAKDTEAYFGQTGVSLDDLERDREASVFERKLRDAIDKAEVDKTFAESKSDFDTARVSTIAVKDEALAKELLQQLQEEDGEFGTLARAHSIGLQRDVGGQAGWTWRKNYDEATAHKVFAAKAGDIVGPVKTGKAWSIIRVEERKDAELNPGVELAIRAAMVEKTIGERLASAAGKA